MHIHNVVKLCNSLSLSEGHTRILQVFQQPRQCRLIPFHISVSQSFNQFNQFYSVLIRASVGQTLVMGPARDLDHQFKSFQIINVTSNFINKISDVQKKSQQLATCLSPGCSSCARCFNPGARPGVMCKTGGGQEIPFGNDCHASRSGPAMALVESSLIYRT